MVVTHGFVYVQFRLCSMAGSRLLFVEVNTRVCDSFIVKGDVRECVREGKAVTEAG